MTRSVEAVSKEKRPTEPSYRPLEVLANPRTSVLVTEQQIDTQLPILAKAFAETLSTLKNPMLLCLMKGAATFTEDFLRHLEPEIGEINFPVHKVRVTSRKGVDDFKEGGAFIDESEYPFPDVAGFDVIAADDTGDSFLTAKTIDNRITQDGGVLTDLLLATEKPKQDPNKGLIREHPLREGIRVWSLVKIPAIWIFRYGLDNGNPETEEEDRKGRFIEVNWAFEKKHHRKAYNRHLRVADKYLKARERSLRKAA